MNKLYLIIAAILFETIFIHADTNLLNFTFKDYIEVKADYASVMLQISKKSGTFAAATNDCSKVQTNIKNSLIKMGLSDSQITIRDFAIRTGQNLFSNEYIVTGTIEFMQETAKLISSLEELRQIDKDIIISNIFYENKEKESIRKKLAEKIFKKANDYMRFCENLYNIKLELSKIQENFNDQKDQQSDNYSQKYSYSERGNKFGDNYELEIPAKVFYMDINFVFNIVNR